MSAAPKFRRKPVVEAVRFNGSSTHVGAIERWAETGEYVAPTICTADMRSMVIPTPEGQMTARPGDWIVSVQPGDFYPVKPAIFAATYEPVEAGA